MTIDPDTGSGSPPKARVAAPRPVRSELPARFRRRAYPDCEIDGYARNDSQILFYRRVRELITPESTVLDFGAGRGEWEERLPPEDLKRRLMHLQGDVAKMIGTDVEATVLDHPWMDAAVVSDEGRVPLPTHSVDLVVSHATFEHVVDAAGTMSELWRVLRPGGWICAWTPAKWNYVAVVARATPGRFRSGVLAVATPTRLPEDIFPTHYRLNTRSAVRRHLPPAAYDDHSYYVSGPPGYHAGSNVAAYAFATIDRLLPAPMQRHLHVFIHKHEDAGS